MVRSASKQKAIPSFELMAHGVKAICNDLGGY